MIQKIKRLYINFVHSILRLYWFIVRPVGRGVKVLLRHEGKFLFVRHNYGHRQWTIPGGGVKSGELSELAAVREVYEELNMVIDHVTFIGRYESDYEYKKVTVDCYTATPADANFQIDDFEIAEAKWFYLNELPPERASSVDRILKLYEENKN